MSNKGLEIYFWCMLYVHGLYTIVSCIRMSDGLDISALFMNGRSKQKLKYMIVSWSPCIQLISTNFSRTATYTFSWPILLWPNSPRESRAQVVVGHTNFQQFSSPRVFYWEISAFISSVTVLILYVTSE
jgi:hypothetical protein